jgi:hypothetical protein
VDGQPKRRPTKAEDAEAWAAYLAEVLPPEQVETAASAKTTLAILRQQFAERNPIRAAVEREWLLLHVPTDQLFALAKDLEPWPDTGPAYWPLLCRWARQDPQQALAFASMLPPADVHDAMKMVISAWSQSSPATALAYLKTCSDSSSKREGVSQDTQPALALAGTLTTGEVHDAMQMAISAWAQSDPATALAYLETCSDSSLKSKGLGEALRALAKTDPQGALAHLGELEPSQRSGLLREITSSWVQVDAAGAVDWIQTSAPPDERDSLLHGAVRVLSSGDPQSAVKILIAIPRRPDSYFEVQDIFRQLAIRDPDAAFATFSSLPAEWQLPEVARQAAQSMGMRRINAQDAIAWAEQFPAGNLREAALAGFVEYGTYNNHEFAASVAPSLPEGATRQAALGRLAERWGQSDAPAAAKWLMTLPPSPSTDSAVINFGSSIETTNPDAAAQWLATLQDQSKRNESFRKVFPKWRAQDPQSAEAWLAQSAAFSAQEKSEFLGAGP